MPTYLATVIAMIAFAANSILCRLALAQGSIDPGSFTVIRIVSGFLTLAIIHFAVKAASDSNGSSKSALLSPESLLPKTKLEITLAALGGLSLFAYAIGFSYAYVELAAGTGALLLFGSVQMTMIGFHIFQGNTLNRYETLGLTISLLGFAFLMLPSASAPDLFSALLMVAAGVSWAALTLLGKRSSNVSPRASMTRCFMAASVVTLLLSPWLMTVEQVTLMGFVWAILSGAFASGVGYVIWYFALTQLTVLKASVAQLSVPIIALIAGALLLGESLSVTVVMTSLMILGGIALIFLAKNKTN
ncbi:DMT family transporter [uncultured Vibrio sp.]|uniref:DMT family transporter n=1 Tax=uncultured Vibrio sp. TaxID=114054 RepID=UPI0025E96EE0|nr:DMT family transporter [uncultured Vibrio sp.]